MNLRCSLWRLSPFLDCLNQDRKKGKKSTFERNLNVAVTSWSTSFRVRTAIPCVLSLNFENRGEYQVDRWLIQSRRNIRKPPMYRKRILKCKSGMALNRSRSKWLIFQTLPTSSIYSISFKIELWWLELRLIQSSILGNSMKDIYCWYDPIRERFLVKLLLFLMMQLVIAWLNKYSRRQLSTIAQPWTGPVFVLKPSWPTFSLFLPVQFSLFTLLWAEFFISSSIQNAKGVSIISEWPSQKELFGYYFDWTMWTYNAALSEDNLLVMIALNSSFTCAFYYIDVFNIFFRLSRDIAKVLQNGRLQAIYEAQRYSPGLIHCLSHKLRNPFLRICQEIGRISHSNHGRCTKRDVLFAAQRVLPFSLFLTAQTACHQAGAFYASSLSQDQTKAAKCLHSGLHMDVGLVHGFMILELKAGKIVHDLAAVYMTAIMQNIVEELVLVCMKSLPANQQLTEDFLQRRLLEDAEYFGIFQVLLGLRLWPCDWLVYMLKWRFHNQSLLRSYLDFTLNLLLIKLETT